MKRELPKNVRQIGNVSDSSKIYVEDYVDTYLNQLCEKADQALIGAFLIGEIVQEGEEDYIYIYGAVQMKELQQKGRDVFVPDATWKEGCENCKQYFGNAEILGWFLTSTGLLLEANHNLLKVHQKLFSREKSILILKEAREKDEKYFVHKFRNLMENGGHYIYYEKNNEMQDYMIASRKKNGMTPSEVIEDTAIKNFRSMIREKMEKKEKKESSRWVYAVSTALVLIVIVIGVSTLNDYGRMSAFRNMIEKWQKDDENEVVENTPEEPQTEIPVVGEVVSVGDVGEEDREDKETVGDLNSEANNNEPENPEPSDTESSDTEPSDTEPHTGDVPADSPYSDGVYVVEKGDTLAIISRKVYGDLDHIDAICRMNGLKNGNLILVGQKLLLP